MHHKRSDIGRQERLGAEARSLDLRVGKARRFVETPHRLENLGSETCNISAECNYLGEDDMCLSDDYGRRAGGVSRSEKTAPWLSRRSKGARGLTGHWSCLVDRPDGYLAFCKPFWRDLLKHFGERILFFRSWCGLEAFSRIRREELSAKTNGRDCRAVGRAYATWTRAGVARIRWAGWAAHSPVTAGMLMDAGLDWTCRLALRLADHLFSLLR